jgi:prephenate dehydratase
MTGKRGPTFAFQGVPGAFSHSAGKLFAERLGHLGEALFVPCHSFNEMFESVLAGKSDYGVVPLENSSIGSISVNYDLLWDNAVTLIGEVSIAIHHHLIGLDGAEPAELEEIYSHPAALDQCRKLFGELAARPVVYFDTSGAARFVRESNDPKFAAIAGEMAAEEHGLKILRRNIEDYPENRTRFGIIAAANEKEPPAVSVHENCKVSCAVELPHSPGSLSQLLTGLASLEVNLTKIESRPIPEAPWHYRFFIDLELPAPAMDSAMVDVLKKSSESFKVLGRYKAWTD